ncbi:hypothetical protein AB0J86_10020 [Micromonospora sp. NPDC049559]|uniref:hypothetical protein n=1 Tax=Micromonospora sp. NPDC049559 TaxID=3155923 RepID=UPI0034317221
MVYVRLDGEWTDGDGVSHAAGEMIDVDAATLAKLQAAGVVSEGAGKEDWAGPGSTTTGWAGPGSTKP